MSRESKGAPVAFLAGLLALAAVARGEDDLKTRFEAKLTKPFLKKVAWIQDYDAALAQARAMDKLVFAYFARSYEP
jgi:hypothetical protein